MKNITVAVSGINAIDNPGPGTGIIRALKQSSFTVRAIGLAYDALEPGIYLDNLVDKSYIMPYPSGGKDSFLERIQYIHEQEKMDVLIPALDAELPVYIHLEEELKKMGIKMLIPTKKMFGLRDKTALKSLAGKIGIKAPEYVACSSLTDLHKAIETVHFPCMIKGPFYEAFRADTIEQAEKHFHKLEAKWGYPILAQEFIFGDEYDVIGCGDGLGKDLGIFAIKKMTLTSLGKVWNAVSIQNEKLTEITQNLVRHLQWRGGFEMEILIDSENQEPYLLEINPRFPAWVYMSAACGINLPERMVRFLMNNESQFPGEYLAGKMMIRYTYELLKDMKDFEQMVHFGELENHEK
jgi:carbamoyl-phosphate synthase large subunit